MAPACFVLLPDFSQVDVCEPEVLFPGDNFSQAYGAFYFKLCKDSLSEIRKSGRTFGELSELTMLSIRRAV